MKKNRIILHADLNNFYASVECLYNPGLRGKPVAVGGDAEKRHGIILAKNNEAKAFGVKTGETLWQARQKCPGLIFVKPRYDLYVKYSRLARSLYEEYTSQVESFGLDECWLDVTNSETLWGDGKRIADEIRLRVKRELGVTVSIGVSFNKVFAKLGSDMKKPDATTVIPRETFQKIVWPLPVENLLFVGRATTRKLKSTGVRTIGDLAQTNVNALRRKFGKPGEMLWNFANGRDESRVSEADAAQKIKTIGNSSTLPRDLISEEDVKIPLYILCESVAERLRDHSLKCCSVQLSLRDNGLFQYERQGPLICPTCSAQVMFEKVFALYRGNHLSNNPIRSIGVRALKLVPENGTQLSLLPELQQVHRREAEEAVIDSIRRRYGHFSIQRGIMLLDTKLSGFDPKGEHIIHPEVFVR